ncbi:helix-turn-helix domain-containing protein [Nocardia sp. A7]|uniref:helix-turn-helix domain-containing protein n=1 Tax=Nocardia sp. A7 TaxID=2789274 RepID=UPI00397D60C2
MSDDRLSESAAIAPNTEITALAQQVATARDKLPLQHDTALYDALSDDEIRAERELAEWIRAQRRKQRRRAIADELAADQRDRRTGTLIRRTDEADARWHRKALAARRRVSSADARLAQLYRRAEWSSRALIGVVILGMVWAGVNVQHNLVPSGDMSDPLYWLSFGIEAMISIPIIVIMIAATTAARWGRELDRGKVLLFELALLGTTVALNAGPHLASGSFGRAAEFAIAPVMVGVVIWLHAWVSARYAMLIESASVELPGDSGYAHAERLVSTAFPRQAAGSLGDDRQALAHTVMNGVAPELRSPLRDAAVVGSPAPHAAESQDTRSSAMPDKGSLAAETDRETIASAEQTITADREAVESPVRPVVPEPVVLDTPTPSAEPLVAEAEIIAATATERAYPHGLRRPSTDKPNAPGTLELIHKAAADHRRNGTEHSARTTNGAAPSLRRIPVTTVAHATAGDATGTDPVPEATMHAGTVARDPDGDTSAPTDPVAVHNDPQPAVAAPAQLVLPAEPAEQLVLQTEPEPTPEPDPIPVVDQLPEPTPDPVDLDEADEDLPDDFNFDEDTEVRALARKIAHRSPLRLTLDQIEEILELTDQSWSARSIGSEVGVPSSTVTNIVEFAHKIRQPYAFTG